MYAKTELSGAHTCANLRLESQLDERAAEQIIKGHHSDITRFFRIWTTFCRHITQFPG